MFKVIIAGGRDFDDYERLHAKCNHMLQNCLEIEVVSGCAKGADSLGERYAKHKGYPIKKFPADWDKHGKSAGYIRNEEMAQYADAVIAFWDGESRGARHMIGLGEKYSLKVKVFRYTPLLDCDILKF